MRNLKTVKGAEDFAEYLAERIVVDFPCYCPECRKEVDELLDVLNGELVDAGDMLWDTLESRYVDSTTTCVK